MAFGKELIIDLYDCDVEKFNRSSIKQWLDELCKLIDMKQEDLYFWDYKWFWFWRIIYFWKGLKLPTEKHLLGTSAIQFITTSNITIHTLDLVGECYINIFSCKDFDIKEAASFSRRWFEAKKVWTKVLERGTESKV